MTQKTNVTSCLLLLLYLKKNFFSGPGLGLEFEKRKEEEEEEILKDRHTRYYSNKFWKSIKVNETGSSKIKLKFES